MASSSSSGLTFKLHPLVIVNISDHYTRVKSQMNPTHAPPHTTTNNNNANGGDGVVSPLSPRVYGCVIGVQKGRTVEIFNSFELLYDPSSHSLDRTFLEKKQELCSVFLSLPLSIFMQLWLHLSLISRNVKDCVATVTAKALNILVSSHCDFIMFVDIADKCGQCGPNCDRVVVADSSKTWCCGPNHCRCPFLKTLTAIWNLTMAVFDL